MVSLIRDKAALSTPEETDEEAEAVEADLGTAGIDGMTKT